MAGKVVIQKAVTSEGLAFPLLLGESAAPAPCRSAICQAPVCSRKREVTTHLIPGLSRPHTAQWAWHRIQASESLFKNLPLHLPLVRRLFSILTLRVTFSSLLNTSYLHPTSKLNSFQLAPVTPEKSVFFYGSVQGLPSASGLNNCFISYRSLI